MQSQDTIRTEQPAWRAGVVPMGAEGLSNPGPFYCMTVGTPCFVSYSTWVRIFEEQADGSKRLTEAIQPGVLYSVEADAILIDTEEANGKGNNNYKRSTGAGEEIVTDVPTNPGDNVRYLNQTHRESGLRFFPAFEGHDRRIVRPRLFSTLLRPTVLTPEYQEENPEVAKAVATEGALAVYEKMFKAGSERIKSAEFASQYSEELQRLYVAALPTVVECYRAVRTEATVYLNAADARVRQGAAKGAHYDSTGAYYQYLLARTGVDEALTRALTPQTLVIEDKRAAQMVDVPTVPQIQCEACGEWSNLLASGNPLKFCKACREPFEQVEAVAPKETAAEKLVRKQAEVKARNS